MKYCRAAWTQERASWRAVIQLNVLRSIITIVEVLETEMRDGPINSTPHSFSAVDSDAVRQSSSTTSSEFEAAFQPLSIALTDKHRILKLRLGPLKRVESDLKKRLGVNVEETESRGVGVMGEGMAADTVQKRTGEFGVMGWKETLGAWMKYSKSAEDGKSQLVDDATEVIAICREDMKALWMDQTVQEMLRKRRIRLQDSAGLLVHSFLVPDLRS
jgi:guanine nucleotide-binding protein alpha-1 subunit